MFKCQYPPVEKIDFYFCETEMNHSAMYFYRFLIFYSYPFATIIYKLSDFTSLIMAIVLL